MQLCTGPAKIKSPYWTTFSWAPATMSRKPCCCHPKLHHLYVARAREGESYIVQIVHCGEYAPFFTSDTLQEPPAWCRERWRMIQTSYWSRHHQYILLTDDAATASQMAAGATTAQLAELITRQLERLKQQDGQQRKHQDRDGKGPKVCWLLHHCITVTSLSHHCITASLHHCHITVTSLHHCITASLHHCITASLHHCITASLHHCITVTSLSHHCHITASLHHCITALRSDGCAVMPAHSHQRCSICCSA